MKPWYLTSEAWASIIAQIVGLLVMVGGIASTDADHIKTLGQEVVGGALALVSLIQYIKSRTALKQAVVDNMPPIPEVDPLVNASNTVVAKTTHERYAAALRKSGV